MENPEDEHLQCIPIHEVDKTLSAIRRYRIEAANRFNTGVIDEQTYLRMIAYYTHQEGRVKDLIRDVACILISLN